VRTILKLFEKLRIFKIDICYARLIFYWARLICAELILANGELLELHNVLCECAGLVTEDVLDHAEFFVQT